MLTVGINLPSEGFQVGAAKGSTVVFAQGLEIDLARALAAKLRLRRAVFVQSRFDQSLSPGPKRFDMAVAQITVTKTRRGSGQRARPRRPDGLGRALPLPSVSGR